MSEGIETWSGPAILHVDIDAFFAAVEQLDHPEWRGRAVIVGGSPDGRGVVSTASYEARRYGIHSAMPAARAARLAPADAVWARPRFDRYQEISAAVMSIVADISPHVRQVSVDEAYLDVSPGLYGGRDPVEAARDIRARVAELGITCSVGVSTSRTVAKIASDHDKPDGLTVVRPGQEADFLAPLPIRAMGGIGPKSAARLNGFGIHTLGELGALDNETSTQLFGPSGPELVRRARGDASFAISTREPVKSVSNERTFAQDLRDPADVHRAVISLAERVARRLRRKGLAGKTVHIKIRFSDFTTKTVQRTLRSATDDENAIGPVADELVRSVWNPGVGVRLLGVGVTGLDDTSEQLDLFARAEEEADDVDVERSKRLLRGMDAVRERFGEDAIVRGTRLTAPKTTGTPATSLQPDDLADDE